MAGLLGYAAAGALSGLGKGIEADGKAKREEALRALEHQRGLEKQDREFAHRSGESQKDRDLRLSIHEDDKEFRSTESQKDRDFRAGEGEKDRKFRTTEGDKERAERRGLLGNQERFTDGEGRMWVRTPDGVKPLNAPDGKQLSGSGSGELSASDKRLWDVVVKRHTKEDELGMETTDWDAAAREFDQRGRSDMARLASPSFGAQPSGTSSGGKTGGADVKGQLGTRQNPHRPKTQAEFDALPPGAIFVNPADGKILRKN